jgi:hypothetical protein
MTEATVLKLFKEFTNGTVDLFGLKCIPVDVNMHGSTYTTGELRYQIDFEIENPSNISYFGPIVYEELSELVFSFSEYINIKVATRILWEDFTSKFYLNGEIRNKIQKVFDSVKEIKFTTGTPFIGYKKYVINIESIGLHPSSHDDEAFYIINKVKALSATKNDKPISVDDALYEYIDEFLPHKEHYYESENLYIKIDSIITKYPLLNADYIATYYDTKFIR